MGTLDKGLPISGNLASLWWQVVAPALISGWTSRRFQIDLAMSNGQWAMTIKMTIITATTLSMGSGDGEILFFFFFAEAEGSVTGGPDQGTDW